MRRFAFKLDPLLKKHEWDLDILRTEKANASRAVESLHDQLHQIGCVISHWRNSLVGLSGAESAISVQQREVIELYLKHQQQLGEERREALSKAERIEQEIAQNLLAALQQVKALQTLKRQEKKQHDYLQSRAELTAADDNWLNRRNHTTI